MHNKNKLQNWRRARNYSEASLIVIVTHYALCGQMNNDQLRPSVLTVGEIGTNEQNSPRELNFGKLLPRKISMIYSCFPMMLCKALKVKLLTLS